MIGYIAAFLTTFSGIPQIIRLVRLKESRDISLLTTMFLCLGVLLWLVYGIIIRDMPLIAANSISLCLSGTMFFLVLKYR
jgi:MtN3 and saliva related transmembrane protein